MKNIKVSLYVSTSDAFDIEQWAKKDPIGHLLVHKHKKIIEEMNATAGDNILGWQKFEELRLEGHKLYSKIVDIGEDIYKQLTGLSLLPEEGEIISYYVDSIGGNDMIKVLDSIKEKILALQKTYGTENTDFYIETQSGSFEEV